MATKKMNHYEVLDITNDAELIDIKKAYRRLALKHHPDRNNGSDESTAKFKEISQAYTILADPKARRNYDLYLKNPQTSVSTAQNPSSNSKYSTTSRRKQPDAFQQFDDLFRNDPFFSESFQNMDDAFAKRFQDTRDNPKCDNHDVADNDVGVGSIFSCVGSECVGPKQPSEQKQKVSWTQWLMNKLGIELSVTSYSHGPNGSVVASAYSSKPTGTYTNKTSRTYVENGRRVTILSMEKDGNTIEDKLIEGKLIERKVNGKAEVSSLES